MSQRGNRMGLGSKEWGNVAGAISTTDFHKYGAHSFSTTISGGAATLALPDGEHQGQLCFLKAISIPSTAQTLTVTPTNMGDGSTLTADGGSEKALLIWMGSAWEIVSNTMTLS